MPHHLMSVAQADNGEASPSSWHRGNTMASYAPAPDPSRRRTSLEMTEPGVGMGMQRVGLVPSRAGSPMQHGRLRSGSEYGPPLAYGSSIRVRQASVLGVGSSAGALPGIPLGAFGSVVLDNPHRESGTGTSEDLSGSLTRLTTVRRATDSDIPSFPAGYLLGRGSGATGRAGSPVTSPSASSQGFTVRHDQLLKLLAPVSDKVRSPG